MKPQPSFSSHFAGRIAQEKQWGAWRFDRPKPNRADGTARSRPTVLAPITLLGARPGGTELAIAIDIAVSMLLIAHILIALAASAEFGGVLAEAGSPLATLPGLVIIAHLLVLGHCRTSNLPEWHINDQQCRTVRTGTKAARTGFLPYPAGAQPMDSSRQRVEVQIPPFGLGGTLVPPAPGRGLVLFAHGSGSSRFSPRNTYVANALQQAGLGTLLFDLLTESESADRRNVFDIGLLADRLLAATGYIAHYDGLDALRIGYFGASTGAGAALFAAARSPLPIGAIVSRGGRPDLAGDALGGVSTPTLLIVGSLDGPVITLNEQAYAQLIGEKRLAIIQGAGHLFEEPGTLDAVIDLATDWFVERLTPII